VIRSNVLAYRVGRTFAVLGIAGGLLAGGQAIVSALDGDQSDQATCTQQITPVLGLTTVCENYADSSWGGDF
jgi:hypothetical protein